MGVGGAGSLDSWLLTDVDGTSYVEALVLVVPAWDPLLGLAGRAFNSTAWAPAPGQDPGGQRHWNGRTGGVRRAQGRGRLASLQLWELSGVAGAGGESVLGAQMPGFWEGHVGCGVRVWGGNEYPRHLGPPQLCMGG